MAKEKRFDVIVCFPPGVSGARYAINDTVNGTRVVTVLDNDVEFTKITDWVDWLNGIEDENEVLDMIKTCQLSLGALPAVDNLPMGVADPKSPTLARIAAATGVACRKVNAVPALTFTTSTTEEQTSRFMIYAGSRAATKFMIEQKPADTLDESLKTSELEF